MPSESSNYTGGQCASEWYALQVMCDEIEETIISVQFEDCAEHLGRTPTKI